jgi:hypothetical protein
MNALTYIKEKQLNKLLATHKRAKTLLEEAQQNEKVTRANVLHFISKEPRFIGTEEYNKVIKSL